MKWSLFITGIVISSSLGFGTTAQAQGLLWKLPDDGAFIRYEGTYSQLVHRPDSSEGDLELQWRRNLTIKSVGQEQAEFKGEMQACRWIEFKVETGKTSEGVLDAGPGGIRMYKLLVPESEIRGTIDGPATDDRTLFVSHIPYVKAYRKIGDEGAFELKTGVFQLYPMVSFLRHYRKLTSGDGMQDVNVPAGNFSTTLLNGKTVTETETERSTNTCEMFRSDASPFGVVKWKATTIKERKGTVDPRSAFEEIVILTEELQAVSIGTDAESEFLVN